MTPRDNAVLRRLVWLYFWLLILEGVLRKWVLPSLSTPLLLIRDPIPLAMLWIGVRTRAFPRTVGVYLWALLALACFVAGLLAIPNSPQVVIYGLKCDFLHLIVLAMVPIVFDGEDLDRMIRAIIYISVPIALLMAWQFHSPNNSWINSGIDGTFKQLDSAQGHVRPPGPFSYTAGPACFCALLAAVLTGAAVDRRPISRQLLFVGAVALVVASLYSSSRGLVAGVAIVIAAGLVGALANNPRVAGRYVGILFAIGFVALVIGSSSMMQDTVEVFSSRISNSSLDESANGGALDRYFGEFTRVVPALAETPLVGDGLGVGTNGGASALTGSAKFLLSEEELPRLVQESGPVLGLLIIGFRLYLVLWLGWRSLQAVRRGTVLAACLFGACAVNLLLGHFGQATVVGFTVLTAGLCLAAAQLPTARADDSAGAAPCVLQSNQPLGVPG
ncbi:MAG: hypothetical protein ACYC96_08965 [Fimbriimonadaceae bacterium]